EMAQTRICVMNKARQRRTKHVNVVKKGISRWPLSRRIPLAICMATNKLGTINETAILIFCSVIIA
uniref:Uncharacterized protein n=1 Tax=Parascaris univalens TaxID=6257 RepID=A0A915CEY4_PARUN